MAGELLLINPRKRRAKRRSNPVAANPRKRRARRRNPIAALANPRRRTYRRVTRKSNPMRARRRRSNPIGGGTGAMGLLQPALIGGIGATVVDIGYEYLRPNLPAQMQLGMVGNVTKAGITLLIGVFGSRFLGRMGRQGVVGALTTQVRDIAISMAPGLLPGPRMAGMGYQAASPFVHQGGVPNLGYYSSAITQDPSQRKMLSGNGSQMGAFMPRTKRFLNGISGFSGSSGVGEMSGAKGVWK